MTRWARPATLASMHRARRSRRQSYPLPVPVTHPNACPTTCTSGWTLTPINLTTRRLTTPCRRSSASARRASYETFGMRASPARKTGGSVRSMIWLRVWGCQARATQRRSRHEERSAEGVSAARSRIAPPRSKGVPAHYGHQVPRSAGALTERQQSRVWKSNLHRLSAALSHSSCGPTLQLAERQECSTCRSRLKQQVRGVKNQARAIDVRGGLQRAPERDRPTQRAGTPSGSQAAGRARAGAGSQAPRTGRALAPRRRPALEHSCSMDAAPWSETRPLDLAYRPSLPLRELTRTPRASIAPWERGSARRRTRPLQDRAGKAKRGERRPRLPHPSGPERVRVAEVEADYVAAPDLVPGAYTTCARSRTFSTFGSSRSYLGGGPRAGGALNASAFVVVKSRWHAAL